MDHTGCHVDHTGCHVDHTGCHVDHTGCRMDHTGCHQLVLVTIRPPKVLGVTLDWLRGPYWLSCHQLLHPTMTVSYGGQLSCLHFSSVTIIVTPSGAPCTARYGAAVRAMEASADEW
jgi:hypothetical protein